MGSMPSVAITIFMAGILVARGEARAPVARQIEEAVVVEHVVDALADDLAQIAEDRGVGDEADGLAAELAHAVAYAAQHLVFHEGNEALQKAPLERAAEDRE